MTAPFYIHDLLYSATTIRWGASAPLGSQQAVTYSFPTTAPSIPGYATVSGFRPFSTVQQEAAQRALAYISSFTNILFVQVSASDPIAALRFGNADLTSAGVTQFSYSFSAGILTAGVFLSNAGAVSGSDFVPGGISSDDVGGFGWSVLLHEIGHALGLKHPFEPNASGDPDSILPSGLDNIVASVMSYTPFTPSVVLLEQGAGARSAYLYPRTYGPFDIAALQYLYGVNAASAGGKVFAFFPDAPVFETISDAGPNDVVDCSQLTGDCRIDLTPGASSDLAIRQNLTGGWSVADAYTGENALTIAYGVLIADVVAGSGADTITGNVAANKITGGPGDDAIDGGFGVDTLVYQAARSAASVTRNADGSVTISDAVSGSDHAIRAEWAQFSDKREWIGPVARDFARDGKADLLLQNRDGAVVVGALAGGVATYAEVTALGKEWSFEGSGDFFGDLRIGFLIENTSGAVVVGEFANGATSYAEIASLGSEWTFVGTGDFLGAGSDQFLIENDDGAIVVGDAQSGQAHYTRVAALGSEWKFVGSGDFLGTGRDAFLIKNDDGAIVVGDVQNGQAHYTQVAALGTEWTFVGTGDFLGLGHDAFLIENKAGAVVVGDVQNGQAQYTQVGGLGDEWSFIDSGDYLGDGSADFVIENKAGEVFLGAIANGQASYAQIGALGSEWSSRG